MSLETDGISEVVYIPQSHEEYDQKLQPDKPKRRNDTWFLYLSAFTANLVFLSGAMDMVWTSPVIPKLQSDDPRINPLGRAISPYEVSLIAGLPRFGGILGTIIFAKLPDIVGRKRGLIYSAVAMLISNQMVVFGRHIYFYYAGKALYCTFFGGMVITLTVYLCEIAEDHNRVKYICLMSMSVPIGNLLSYIAGPIATSYQMMFINVVISVWTFAYPLAAHYLGIQYCLWLFSFNCFIGLVGIYFILPETKGKSIIEIQEMLNGK